MKLLVTFLLALLLTAGVAIAALLVLPACSVNAQWARQWLNTCDTEDTLAARAQAELVAEHNTDLQLEVARLERELAALQCTAEYAQAVPQDVPPLSPLPTAEPPPDLPSELPPDLPPELPDLAEEPPAIDGDAWERGDLSVLAGCWELDSDYSVEHLQTGEITHFNQWQMCFDEDGQGTERMRATNGVTCDGPVQGAFDDAGRLVIQEPDNLVCSNRNFIYKRTVGCALDANGRAHCTVVQPEINRSSEVQIRRTPGGE